MVAVAYFSSHQIGSNLKLFESTPDPPPMCNLLYIFVLCYFSSAEWALMDPAINVLPLLCLIIHVCLMLLFYSTAFLGKILYKSGLIQALWAEHDIVSTRFRGLILTGGTHAKKKKKYVLMSTLDERAHTFLYIKNIYIYLCFATSYCTFAIDWTRMQDEHKTILKHARDSQ